MSKELTVIKKIIIKNMSKNANINALNTIDSITSKSNNFDELSTIKSRSNFKSILNMSGGTTIKITNRYKRGLLRIK
jgi:hypothetical protein